MNQSWDSRVVYKMQIASANVHVQEVRAEQNRQTGLNWPEVHSSSNNDTLQPWWAEKRLRIHFDETLQYVPLYWENREPLKKEVYGQMFGQ